MPNLPVSPYVLPILMLIASNVFMTIAWYGHLRFKEVPLAGVILASWGIAFVSNIAWRCRPTAGVRRSTQQRSSKPCRR